MAILADENRLRGAHLRDARRIRDLYSPLQDLISDILSRGQAEGTFRANVDPVHLYISITGLGYFYFSNLYTLSAIFSRHLDGEDEIALREQHVVDTVMGFLRP
jgi:TetR/AcrR family transcriptional regulator